MCERERKREREGGRESGERERERAREKDLCCAVGTPDAETKVPSARMPELSRVLSFMPGVGQRIALPHARNGE